ncbi:MAG: hypothetical protein JO356_16440 [Acidobacteria bacterium]|nr:hypothetical protein [Acidobacteriota bacterium]
MRLYATLLITASLAFGQAPPVNLERVYYLTYAPTVQDFQEIVNVTRTIAGIREVSADTGQKAMTLHGTPDQLALADWLVAQLNRPVPLAADLSTHEYTAGKDDLVRIFYLTEMASVQDFQEAVNTIRTISTIRQAFTENAQRALVLRGTVDQIAVAGWLVEQVAQPPSSDRHEYRAGSDDVVRVFYLTQTGSLQTFQQSINTIRTAANIRQAFTVAHLRMLALRGTSDQMAQAEQLIKDRGLGF